MMDARKKYLIVNADDFGQSPGVNRGIIEAHENGIVRTASLMVRWPAARDAAAYARGHPELSVGLHVDLGEWVCRDGQWEALYEVVSISDATAVASEISLQLASFYDLIGLRPTHIDSHQHVHLREPVRSILTGTARRLGVPLRHFSSGVRYRGEFYGQTEDGSPLPSVLSVDGLIRILEALSPGATELGCHPGEGDDLETMYRRERAQEVRILCDGRVRAAIAGRGIDLCSFKDLACRIDEGK